MLYMPFFLFHEGSGPVGMGVRKGLMLVGTGDKELG